MIDRMLVEANFFRISRLGFDVKFATGLQLAFSESQSGLVPETKGSFGGTVNIALPTAGYVPIIFIVMDGIGTYSAKVNVEKTVLSIYGSPSPSGRYVIFKNRQF